MKTDQETPTTTNFSPEWDERFRSGTHISRWPWSDLVSYFMRYVKPEGSSFRVLELGCGSGANIPFFQRLGVQYHAIEGSAFIVQQLKQWFPGLADQIVCGDFTQEIPFEGPFDAIIDRGAMTCNLTNALRQTVENIHSKLKPGGKYLGIDWFSTESSYFLEGRPAEDALTRTGFAKGTLDAIGRVHFSDRAHIEDLFRKFKLLVLDHKIIRRSIPAEDPLVEAVWHFVAQKEK